MDIWLGRIFLSDIVIDAPLIVALPVAWTDAFSCIGLDSALRLVEMGDPDCELQIILQKNPNDVDTRCQSPAPPRFNDVHHTTKMPVARKSGGTSVSLEPLFDHVFGHGCRNEQGLLGLR